MLQYIFHECVWPHERLLEVSARAHKCQVQAIEETRGSVRIDEQHGGVQ